MGLFPAYFYQDTPALQMPLDVISQILMRLKGREIGVIALVCKQWCQMLNDNDNVWRLFCSFHFPTLDQNKIVNFKSAYQTIYSNFRNTIYTSHTLQGHRNAILSLAILDAKLISGSADKTIKIWDLSKGECTKVVPSVKTKNHII